MPRSDQRLREPLLFGQGVTRPGDLPTPGLWWPKGQHYAQNSAQNFIFDIGQALTWAELLGKDPWGADTRIRAIRLGEGAIKGTLADDCELIPPAVKDPSRCMRLPGAWYIHKDGRVGDKSTLLNITGDRFTPELFEELLPPLPERPRHIPKSLYRKQPTRTLQDIADALKFIPPRVPGHGNYPVDRNMAWGLKAACCDAGYGMDVARELLEAHSPNVWDPDQILRSGGDQISAGTFWWQAQQHGYRRPADD